jgi:S-adenosylmethionine:tRNA-ribosyltransferase-isomerase (queuine synthetase)
MKSYEWSDKTKACQLYMLNGNMRIVSEVTEIPYDTLCDWKRSEWWPTLVEEIRAAKRAKTGVKLSSIIDTSLEVLQDRLENGDWVLNNKTGAMVRRPVSLRDATTATNNLLTRQLQMEEIADKMENNKTTVQETLALLAKEFKKMTNHRTKQLATDIEFKEIDNAIHEEREEGLQEGSGPLYLEAGSEEEES